MNVLLQPIRIVRTCAGLLAGVLITILCAGIILIGVPCFERIPFVRKRSNPFIRAPLVWLNIVYWVTYRVCMSITSLVRDDAVALGELGVKVVEMNHGSFMEMFLGFRAALKYVSYNVVLVGKVELKEHWLAKWIIVLPMQRLGRLILIDRNNRDQALQTIRDYITRHGKPADSLVYVILCDQTRPTDAKRRRQNKDQAACWQRVLRPSQGGAWTIISALTEVVGHTPIRIQVAHGISRPQRTDMDAWRVVDGTHHVCVTRICDPLPSTPEEYGPQLTARWRAIDDWLVGIQET